MNWIIVIVFGIIVICVSHWLEGKIDSSLCLLAVEVISIIAIVTAVVVILVGVLETEIRSASESAQTARADRA